MLRNRWSKSKDKMSNQKAQQSIWQSSLQTIALAGLGTAALIGAHHIGRKQYNTRAKLTDYSNGIIVAVKRLSHNKDEDAEESPPLMPKQNIAWVSGVADLKTSDFAVVGINDKRDIVWQTAVPERVHDILIQPLPKNKAMVRHVAVMGRRPSEYFWLLDSATGEVLYIKKSQQARHFYGHACYSLDGTLLYVTENNTADFSGKIGVYDVAKGYQKTAELNAYGIGPHEILMHPDGKTLVIANGGIKTERASREELNLESMTPSLVYIDRHSGRLLEQIYPEHNQMSVRHLAISDTGMVAIGIQFQGERHLSVPLVLTHRLGQVDFTPLTLPENDTKGWYRFHHYIASIAMNTEQNLLCATSPLGGCAAVFDLQKGVMLGETSLPDCAGVTSFDDQTRGFLVSDGQGYLTRLHVADIDDSGSQSNDQSVDKAHKANLIADKVQQPFAFDNHLKRL